MKKLGDNADLKNKRVLLRLDLNVPLLDGVPRDTYRIDRSMRTLEYLRDLGARTIIVAHIDKKEGASLKPVLEYLKKKIPADFSTLEDAPKKSAELAPGKFLLVENLRLYPGEEANDPEFAARLAALGDLYVNEAFSVSHRAHASVVGVAGLLPAYAGFLFVEEIENLSKAFKAPRPFLFVLGGAKFETKMPLVKKFLGLADFCFIGGALANDFFKAKGYEVGLSRVSEGGLGLEKLIENPKLSLPIDVVVENGSGRAVKNPTAVAPADKIYDAGPESLADLASLVEKSAFVLWNGPLGDYEHGFAEGTEKLAAAIAGSRAISVLGGGDTLAVVSKLGLMEKFTFVSTGGGAMLDYLAEGTLPGIDALNA